MPPTKTSGAVYKMWRDSTPTMPFPFVYDDKQEGVIRQTWHDVREGMTHDAQNVALAFCTGHFTPSGLQARIMDEMARREAKIAARARTRVAARIDAGRAYGASVSPGPGAFESSTGDVASLPATLRGPIRAATPMTPDERATLYSPDSRGRASYLKLRLAVDIHNRYPTRRTTAQMYGWDVLPPTRAQSTLPPSTEPRKGRCGVVLRSTGVFPRNEFVT